MPAAARKFLPSYSFCNKELEFIASDLVDITIITDTKVTYEEARQAHLHLNVILKHFVLATRAAGFAAAAEVPPSTPPPSPGES